MLHPPTALCSKMARPCRAIFTGTWEPSHEGSAGFARLVFFRFFAFFILHFYFYQTHGRKIEISQLFPTSKTLHKFMKYLHFVKLFKIRILYPDFLNFCQINELFQILWIFSIVVRRMSHNYQPFIRFQHIEFWWNVIMHPSHNDVMVLDFLP